MRTMKSIAVAIAITACAGLAPAIAADATEPSMSILGGITPHSLTDTEMSKVRGGVIIGAALSSNFLLLQDNAFSYPFAVDLTNPRVIQVLQQARANALPHQTWDQLLPYLRAADPQLYIRAMPGIGGCNTSMGPGTRGFTVGC
jgi:hypothetical protein